MDLAYFKKVKIEAMKAGDKDAVSALNTLINKLMLLGYEKKAVGAEVTEADVVSVLKKCENELTEEREGFVKAGRTETVASLDNQLNTIRKYLPKFMSEDEIRKVIETLPDKSIGAVMKHFKTEYAGKCDMKTVGEVLKGM